MKKRLMASMLSLLLCVSMLVGSTFAWFTDTATTGVNTIQAGKLDVKLEMKDSSDNWVDAENKTLEFLKADGTPAGEKVLWEPGCTYKLPQLRITNKGDLKLKYKVVITGIKGNAELNKAIDWTLTHDGVAYNADGEYAMEPGATALIDISGHMKEDAGNEYQGLSITGIGITVYATQLGGDLNGVSGEYDSDNNTYDQFADYDLPVAAPVEGEPMTPTAPANEGDTITEYTYEDDNVSATLKTANAAGIGLVDPAQEPGITVKPAELSAGNANVTAGAADKDAVAYDIKVENVADDGGKFANGALLYATLPFAAGMEDVAVYHEGKAMTAVNSAAALTAADTFFYDKAKGGITVCIDNCSNFAIVFGTPKAVVNGKLYNTLEEAVTNAAEGDTVKVTGEVKLSTEIPAGVTVSGQGSENTTLNVSTGLEVTASDVTIKDVTIEGNFSGKAPAVKSTAGDMTVSGIKLDDVGAWYGVQSTAASGNLSVENSTIHANERAVYVSEPASSGTVSVKGSVLDALYPINLNVGATDNMTLVVEDSTLNGWTSYGRIASASFTNVKFGASKDYGHAYLRPFTDTTLTDCTFADGFMMGYGNQSDKHTITITNCTYAGEKLTAENIIGKLISTADSPDYGYMKANVTLIVDGVTVVYQ